MKNKFARVVLPALLFSIAAGAYAQQKSPEQKRANWQAAFASADTDKSGGLSMAELGKTGPKKFGLLKQKFADVDANKDGQVTISERDAYIASIKR